MKKDEGFTKFLVTVGTNLKGIRTSRQLKTETVADATGISSNIIDQIENGSFNWEAKQIAQLCEYYEVIIKDIAASLLYVTYTEELKEQMEKIKRASDELGKEDPGKSIDQLLAEVDFTKTLLDEAKPYIH